MNSIRRQADELREAARQFEGYQNGEISRMLREAADAIEGLRDRLQEMQGVTGESRYSELFGTPERAARTLTNVCQFTHGGELCDRCKCYLFGDCDRMLRLRSEQSIYDALLEWLREEGETE